MTTTGLLPFPKGQRRHWKRGWLVSLARVAAAVVDTPDVHVGVNEHVVLQRWPLVVTGGLLRAMRVLDRHGPRCALCDGVVRAGRVWQCGRRAYEKVQLLIERQHRTGVTVDLLTIDHWVPRADGGSNRLRNLRPMCARCNHHKGDIHPDHLEPLRDRILGTRGSRGSQSPAPP